LTDQSGSEIEALHEFVEEFETQSALEIRRFRFALGLYLAVSITGIVSVITVGVIPMTLAIFLFIFLGGLLYLWRQMQRDALSDLTRNRALPVLGGMVGLRYRSNDPSAEFRIKQGRWAGIIKGAKVSICDCVSGSLDGNAFTVDSVKLVDDSGDGEVTRFKGLIFGIELDPGRPPLVIRRAKSQILRTVTEALGGSPPLPNQFEREIRPGRDEPLAVFYHIYHDLAERLERIEKALDDSKTLFWFRVGIRGLLQDETRLLLFLDSEVDWFMLRDVEADGVELTKQLKEILGDLTLCIQLAEIWNNN